MARFYSNYYGNDYAGMQYSAITQKDLKIFMSIFDSDTQLVLTMGNSGSVDKPDYNILLRYHGKNSSHYFNPDDL